MPVRHTCWCPNGCGKKVMYQHGNRIVNNKLVSGIWKCHICGGMFLTKKELL